MHELPVSDSLPPHEKFAACVIACLIVGAIIWNLCQMEQASSVLTDEPHYVVDPHVQVVIKGAVAKPGLYQVQKGTAIEEAVLMAEPLASANVEDPALKGKITRPRTIQVKEKKTPKRKTKF